MTAHIEKMRSRSIEPQPSVHEMILQTGAVTAAAAYEYGIGAKVASFAIGFCYYASHVPTTAIGQYSTAIAAEKVAETALACTGLAFTANVIAAGVAGYVTAKTVEVIHNNLFAKNEEEKVNLGFSNIASRAWSWIKA